jgi:hypothetical protein
LTNEVYGYGASYHFITFNKILEYYDEKRTGACILAFPLSYAIKSCAGKLVVQSGRGRISKKK